ncbi:MAG: hypothetical protein ACR2HY_11115, partial [Acidimicrobiales bacterium]
MAIDIGDLLRVLREDPAQRAALRHALLDGDADLSSALADLTRQVGALAEAQRRTEERLEALAQDVRALAEAQRRTEGRLDALAE